MTSDRSHEHIARLCADGVGEFKDLVIRGATIAHSKVVVRQNSSHRLGHRWLLRHIQNSNRSRHLQASSPQNSQPKENPKKTHHSQLCNYYIALGDAILSASALHCSRNCIAHSHPSRGIRVRILQHALLTPVLVRLFCALDVCASDFVCIWREKERDPLPGINIGTQSILTGLAGIILHPFLVFFVSFLGTNEKLHWEEDSVSFKIYLRRNVCDLRRVLDEKG